MEARKGEKLNPHPHPDQHQGDKLNPDPHPQHWSLVVTASVDLLHLPPTPLLPGYHCVMEDAGIEPRANPMSQTL